MNWLKFLLTKLAQQGSINYLLKSNPSLFKEYQDKKNSIIIPKVYSGEAEEILKKWIFYRSKQGENINLNGLDVILVNPTDKAKNWFTKPDFTFSDLQKKNEEYHEKLKETKNRVYTPKYPISILKQYNNGLAWGRLETSFCRGYGDSLGHCGNVNGEDDDTQRIYTFYDTTTNIHYLTFIYHQNGVLGEAKAYGNSKPPIDKIKILNREDLQSIDAQQVYKDLLLLKDKDQYIWNSIKGAGYKPENNFGFEDLNEKNKEEVKKERENIDDYFSYKKGKDSKHLYFVEDNQAYFNKNITREQFKKIIENDESLLKYYKAYYYIFKYNLQDDKDILTLIASSSHFSYVFAEYSKFDLTKIPDKIIDSIAKSSFLSYNFSEGLKFDLTKIPEIIKKSIYKDPTSSYNFARYLNFDLSKIPKEVIEGISKESYYSYGFAEKLNFDLTKIPKEIIESISKESYDSYNFAKELNFDLNKIPSGIIEGIAKDSKYSYNFAKKLNFDLTKIPEIVKKSIYRDSYFSYEFAIDLNFDLTKIPKEIIECISKNTIFSYNFAKNLNFNLAKIPKEIIERILSNKNYNQILLNQLGTKAVEIPDWIKNYKL